VAINREEILLAAQSLVDKKRYDKALAEYQKILAVDPKDARTVLKVAELHLKREQYETAIGAFEQVAQLHAGQGFALKAVAAYGQARELVQKHVPHLTERYGYLVPRIAELYIELKRNNDAIQMYDEAATRFEAAGRDRDAIHLLRKILELDPQNGDRAGRLAAALLRVGDVDDAVPLLVAHAEAMLKRGQHEDALQLAERGLSLKPEPKLAKLAAEIYLDRGGQQNGAAAFVKIQLLYRQSPKDLETLGLLAKALYVLRQPDKAIEVHKEAARIARGLNDTAAFDAHMETLVARAPNDPGVRKLAQAWPKAPTWMSELAAPPQVEPQRPPPSPGFAAPMPPPQSMAPQRPPPPPPGFAAPMTAPTQGAPTPPQRPPPPPPGFAAPMGALPPQPQRTTPTPPEQAAPPPHTPPRIAPNSPPIPGRPPPPPIPGRPPPPPIPSRMPPMGAPMPAPAPIVIGPPMQRQMTPVVLAPPMQRQMTPPPVVLAPPMQRQMTPPPVAIHGAMMPRPPAITNAPQAPLALELDTSELGPGHRAAEAPPAWPGAPALDPPFRAPELPIEPLSFPDEPFEPPPPSLEPAPFSGRGGFDEDAIEEVEFFVSQGMYEDALAILSEQLQRLPNHPLLLDRQREVEALAAATPADPVA
jgi:tetratricopeptide (TPR) repeat protein